MIPAHPAPGFSPAFGRQYIPEPDRPREQCQDIVQLPEGNVWRPREMFEGCELSQAQSRKISAYSEQPTPDPNVSWEPGNRVPDIRRDLAGCVDPGNIQERETLRCLFVADALHDCRKPQLSVQALGALIFLQEEQLLKLSDCGALCPLK